MTNYVLDAIIGCKFDFFGRVVAIFGSFAPKIFDIHFKMLHVRTQNSLLDALQMSNIHESVFTH